MLGHLGDLCWIIFGYILRNICCNAPITPKNLIMHVRAVRITDTTLVKPTVFAFRHHKTRAKPCKAQFFLNITRRIHCKAQGRRQRCRSTPWVGLGSAAGGGPALSFGEERTLQDATASAGPGDGPLAGFKGLRLGSWASSGRVGSYSRKEQRAHQEVLGGQGRTLGFAAMG